MSYPASVNANVDGFGVADGQDMLFANGSNPPRYDKDPNDTTPYDQCSLRRNSAGTNWQLIVRHGSQMFNGLRDPAADNPVGTYKDSGSQEAVVI